MNKMIVQDQSNNQIYLIRFGILVVYDFALVFALAPISLMFCPKFLPLPLPLPSILPI